MPEALVPGLYVVREESKVILQIPNSGQRAVRHEHEFTEKANVRYIHSGILIWTFMCPYMNFEFCGYSTPFWMRKR